MDIALDSKQFAAAYRAGLGRMLFQMLKEQKGIAFDESLGEMKWLPPDINPRNFNSMAMDVQSELATLTTAGIPAYLATYFDPKVIPVLISPMMAAVIAGERMVGDWLTEVAQFLVAEAAGEVSSYGDYSMSGASNVNTDYPTRQNYIFQAFLQYGQREVARMGLAKVNWASEQQSSNALTLMKALNAVYFYGVAGLENYGLINAPTLYPSLTPTYSWLTSPDATANTIYQDIVRLWTQLQFQSNGVVAEDSELVLAMSPPQGTALKQVTLYNTNSVEALIKENFPNIRILKAVQYQTPVGQLVQMIATNIEGQRTLEAAFSSKLMAHQMVVEPSSWKQKRSSGGYGTVWYRPYLCSSMLG